MILDEKIKQVKGQLSKSIGLDLVAYSYLKNKSDLQKINTSHIRGFENEISIKGYKGIFVKKSEIDLIASKLPNPIFRKAVNVFCLIGLSLVEKNIFLPFLKEEYEKLSNRYKYFISKYFSEEFKKDFHEILLHLEDKNSTPFDQMAKIVHLENEKLNLLDIVEAFQKGEEFDVIDLILMEDYESRKGLIYSRKQEVLLDDLLWISQHIQSKHRIFNNDEDQFNSTFQSLLEAKEYDAKDQTQRGKSSSQTRKSRYGELDILISDKKTGLHLSILEAFKLKTIDSREINKHLLKLLESYDSNGLQQNYAVVYAKSADFSGMWKRYINFLSTVPFRYKTESITDVTTMYPQFSDVKICKVVHSRNEVQILVFHLFLNMNH